VLIVSYIFMPLLDGGFITKPEPSARFEQQKMLPENTFFFMIRLLFCLFMHHNLMSHLQI